MPIKKGERHSLVQNLTDTNIAQLRRGDTQFERSVAGFGVRAYRSGAKAFVVATTFEDASGKRVNKWVTLGPAIGPLAIPLPTARSMAQAELAQLKVNGGATHALTLQKAIDIYAAEPRLAKKTVINTKAMLGKHCKDWLNRRLLSITGAEIVDLYNSLLPTQADAERAARLGKDAPSPAKANSVTDSFRSVWTNAVDRLEFPGGVPPQCPTRALKRHRKKNHTRTGLVHDVHLAQIGETMRAYKGNPAYVPYMLMVILNGMRAGEPSKLRWVFVGEDAFRLPEFSTKQRREVEVPMTTANKTIFDRMRELRGKLGPEEYVFASTYTDAEIRCTRYIARKLLPKGMTKLHNLRRTFVRNCNEVGVPVHMREALVAHVEIKDPSKMDQRYDVKLLADRALWLEKVQAHLLSKLGFGSAEMLASPG